MAGEDQREKCKAGEDTHEEWIPAFLTIDQRRHAHHIAKRKFGIELGDGGAKAAKPKQMARNLS